MPNICITINKYGMAFLRAILQQGLRQIWFYASHPLPMRLPSKATQQECVSGTHPWVCVIPRESMRTLNEHIECLVSVEIHLAYRSQTNAVYCAHQSDQK